MRPGHLLLSAFVFACVALPACSGGGGGSPTPGPNPTSIASAAPSAPGVAYRAQILWTGGLTAPKNLLGTAARVRADAGTASPEPLLVAIEAPQTVPGEPAQFGGNTANAVAYVTVSPAPSAAPAVAWSDPAPNVALASPSPGASVAPQSIVVNPVQVGVSTLSASIASVGTQTQTVETISGLALQCLDFSQQAPTPYGIAFNLDGTYSFTTGPAGADLYITGPPEGPIGDNLTPGGGCSGTFASTAGANYILYAPNGIADLGQNVDFPSIATSQYASPVTSITIPTDPAGSSAFATSDFILKTGVGTYVKIELQSTATNAYGILAGYFEASNTSGAFPF